MAQFFQPRDFVHRAKLGKRERLAVAGVAVPLSSSVYTIPATGGADDVSYVGPKSPTFAIVQVLTAAINFTTDGTTPTNALGFVGNPNDIIYLNTIHEIQTFKAIQNVGAAAIEVQYFYGS